MPVEVDDGVLRLGDDRLVSDGRPPPDAHRRRLAAAVVGEAQWGRSRTPTGKYHVRRSPDPTSVADASRDAGDDRHVGIGTSLERTVLRPTTTACSCGATSSTTTASSCAGSTFVQLRPRAGARVDADDLPKVDAASTAPQPHAIEAARRPRRAEAASATASCSSGVYSQPDGSVQLYYSDGVFGASVFDARAIVDWDALPAGGRTCSSVTSRPASTRPPAGTAAGRGSADDVTYTCVTDASVDEVRGDRRRLLERRRLEHARGHRPAS